MGNQRSSSLVPLQLFLILLYLFLLVIGHWQTCRNRQQVIDLGAWKGPLALTEPLLDFSFRSPCAYCYSMGETCFKISDDESILLSGSDDGTIAVIPIFKLVDRSSKIGNRDSICRFVGHQSSITDIVCGVGGANYCTIMSSSLDCTCKIWSLMYERRIRSVTFPCPILGVVMDSTEWNFYAAGADGMVYRGAVKVSSRQALKEGCKIVPLSHKHAAEVVSIGMINGGQNLITASDDGNAWIWDIESGQMLKILGQDMRGMSCLVVTKVYDDVVMATGGLEAESSGGFWRKELEKPIGEEVLEWEERLKIVVKDRKRSVTNFETATENYTKLLKLILQEATEGNRSDGVDAKVINDV